MVSPCLRTRNPTPPPEGDPADADRAGVAEPGGQPVLADRGGVGAGGQAGLGPGGAAFGVEVQGIHGRQVEHDPALGGAVAGVAVAAAADGQLQPALGGQGHHPGDLGGVGRPGDGRRAAVQAAVEQRPRLVVAGVAGDDHLAVDGGPQPGEVDGRGGRCCGCHARLQIGEQPAAATLRKGRDSGITRRWEPGGRIGIVLRPR